MYSEARDTVYGLRISIGYVDKLKLETSLLLTAGIEKKNCIKVCTEIKRRWPLYNSLMPSWDCTKATNGITE